MAAAADTGAGTDPRVDAYIAAAAPFAQPLLRQLRAGLHAACPGLQETMKWSRPFFMRGPQIVAYIAAFKAHCALGFWHRDDAPGAARAAEAMGQFGRITSAADLPSQTVLQAAVAQALALQDAGAPRTPKAPARPLPAIPDDLLAALRDTPGAQQRWDALPPGQRREQLEAVLDAKRPDTRARRIALALSRLQG